jgi:hypothetical protein
MMISRIRQDTGAVPLFAAGLDYFRVTIPCTSPVTPELRDWAMRLGGTQKLSQPRSLLSRSPESATTLTSRCCEISACSAHAILATTAATGWHPACPSPLLTPGLRRPQETATATASLTLLACGPVG